MVVTCELSPLVLRDLYQLALADRRSMDVVDSRIDAAGKDRGWLEERIEDYDALWRRAIEGQYADAVVVDSTHALFASWLLSPLRRSEPSSDFTTKLVVRLRQSLAAAGLANLRGGPFRVALHLWVVTCVVGDIDQRVPVITPDSVDDANVWHAYLGLLEHQAHLDDGPWPEMIGSSILWRIAGLINGLRPDEELSQGAQVLTGALSPGVPRGDLRCLYSQWAEFVRCRNGFTHLVPGINSYGFGDLLEKARVTDDVLGYIRAATYFIVDQVANQIAATGSASGAGLAERVEADLSWTT